MSRPSSTIENVPRTVGPSPALTTAPQSLAVAIIGCGKISEQHLLALKGVAGAAVVSVCDRSAALARSSAGRFGIEGWQTDLDRMLDACCPAIVHVLTPPATHLALAQACMAGGAHVIVEKLAALSNGEFQSSWECTQQHGVQLIERHNYRFNSPVFWLERTVASGAIGRVEEVEVRMALPIRDGDQNTSHPSHKLPAGMIHEFISHVCYLALRFLDEDLQSIRLAWRNLANDPLFKYDDLDGSIEFPQGRARLRFTCRQWPDEFSITVRGTDGQACAGLFYPMFRLTRRRRGSQHLAPVTNSLAAAKAFLAVASIWIHVLLVGAACTAILIGLQWVRIMRGCRQRGFAPNDARLYSTFCLLGKPAGTLGIITYWLNRARHVRTPLIEYKDVPQSVPKV